MPNSSLIDLKERPSLSITMYLSNASRSCFLRIIKPQKFFVQTFGVTSVVDASLLSSVVCCLYQSTIDFKFGEMIKVASVAA